MDKTRYDAESSKPRKINTIKKKNSTLNIHNLLSVNFNNLLQNQIKTLYNINPKSMNNINKINRFRIRLPDEALMMSAGMIFITKPDLNIFKNADIKNIGQFHQAFYDYPYLIDLLDISNNNASAFINLLTNFAQDFSTQDIQLKTVETMSTFRGHKVGYGDSYEESKNSGTFSIKFKDNRKLEVYKLHKLWVDYINYVKRGDISPKKNYLQNGILDYASALYYFVLAEDGETIVYLTKYLGIFPLTIPDSAFSTSMGDTKQPEYDIEYYFQSKDSFNFIDTMNDFNELVIDGCNNFNTSKNTQLSYAPIYNSATYSAGPSAVSFPYIIRDPNTKKYKLKFSL